VSDEETAVRSAKKLVHDVGKYVSRAARNLQKAPAAGPLHEMLLDDLYRTDGLNRASDIFEALVGPLDARTNVRPFIDRCRNALCRIDALEEAVRGLNESAIREAVRAATTVDDALRAMLSALLGEIK